MDNIPDNKVIWDAVMQSRMDLAELKGMITMHFREGEHHHPPCVPAANLQRTVLTAAGASILALQCQSAVRYDRCPKPQSC